MSNIPTTGPYNVAQRKYGTDGTDSSIGPQPRTDYFKKKALIELAKDQVFSAFADTTAMPKHFGKTIKQLHYLPLLDDRNVNDQGIDAQGLTATRAVTITVTYRGERRINEFTGETPAGADYFVEGRTGPESYHTTLTFKGEGANASTAQNAARSKLIAAANALGVSTASVYNSALSDFEDAGYLVEESADYPVSGNLYGSSKDVGSIAAKLPILGEHGGRVNRVGFKRVEIEGSINKFGIFDEYSRETMMFDSDADLEMHINREMLRGANELTEDMIQMDLLHGAGVVMYAGDAMAASDLTGDGLATNPVTYEDFVKLGIELNNNRCPKQTKMITGSRMVDTKTVDGGYVMFIGPELITAVRQLQDWNNDPAFVDAKHYAHVGLMKGEIGSIDQFRIVVAQEMQHWAGAGANVTDNSAGFRATDGKYDVFPMLVVGQGSFTTVGFQTDGNGVKFDVLHRKPGREAADKNDPYGETGFMSIKWYYGSMILRPERLAVLKTVAIM